MNRNKLDIPKYFLAVYSRQYLGMFLSGDLLDKEIEKYIFDADTDPRRVQMASVATQVVFQLRMFSDQRLLLWNEKYRYLMDMLVFAGINDMLEDVIGKLGERKGLLREDLTFAQQSIKKVIDINNRYNVLTSDKDATSKKIQESINCLEIWLNEIEAADELIKAVTDVTDYAFWSRLKTVDFEMENKFTDTFNYRSAFWGFVTRDRDSAVNALGFKPIMYKIRQDYKPLGDIREMVYNSIKDLDCVALSLGSLINFAYPNPKSKYIYYSYGRY